MSRLWRVFKLKRLREFSLRLMILIGCISGAWALGFADGSISRSIEPGEPVGNPAAACNFSISPEVYLFPATGGEITISIQAFGLPGDSCAWTTTDAVPWITLSRVAGNGSGTLKLTASANNTGAERSGSVAIAGRTFTAFQAANCVYSVNVSPKVYSKTGGSGSVTITANSSACSWSVSESASWVTLTGQVSGLGSKQIPFTVSQNNGPERTTNINVTTQGTNYYIQIVQESNCEYSLSPASPSIGANGGILSVNVATSSICPWWATTSAPWIAIGNQGINTGSGLLNFTVAPNNGPARTGVIDVMGRKLTVTQSSGCAFSINPLSRNIGPGGGTGLVTVSATNSACLWTAVSNHDFLSIVSKEQGQGSDTVVYLVEPNSGAARTGTATIAGKPFTINQSGAINLTPTLTGLAPAGVFAGGAGFSLTVNGTNFNAASIVKWNGVDRPTSFVNESQLQASISAADIATEGSVDVTVSNQAGSGASEVIKFSIFGSVANVSAASFNGEALAAESIVSAYGVGLATQTTIATPPALPTTLGGTRVQIRDSKGSEFAAQLFFVSPNQINYLMPSGLASGKATVTVMSGDGRISVGSTEIAPAAPGLFSADASGKGLASALTLRILPGGRQIYDSAARYDDEQKTYVATPIEPAAPGEQIYLILFGTGLRGHDGLEKVSVEIGGLGVEPLYVGAAPGFLGLDQINVLLPPGTAGLDGQGDVEVVIKIDGKPANIVKVNFR